DAALVRERAPAVRNVRVAGRAAHERLELRLPCQGARHGNRGGREPAHRDRDRAADRTALKGLAALTRAVTRSTQRCSVTSSTFVAAGRLASVPPARSRM